MGGQLRARVETRGGAARRPGRAGERASGSRVHGKGLRFRRRARSRAHVQLARVLDRRHKRVSRLLRLVSVEATSELWRLARRPPPSSADARSLPSPLPASRWAGQSLASALPDVEPGLSWRRASSYSRPLARPCSVPLSLSLALSRFWLRPPRPSACAPQPDAIAPPIDNAAHPRPLREPADTGLGPHGSLKWSSFARSASSSCCAFPQRALVRPKSCSAGSPWMMRRRGSSAAPPSSCSLDLLPRSILALGRPPRPLTGGRRPADKRALSARG